MSSLSKVSASGLLVPGGFVDGSEWQDVYHILTKDGFDVSIVQNSTTSLVADVAAMKQAIAGKSSPVILVGHSYGLLRWRRHHGSGQRSERSPRWSTLQRLRLTRASPWDH